MGGGLHVDWRLTAMAKIQLTIGNIKEWEEELNEIRRLESELSFHIANLRACALTLEAKINQTPEDADA